MTTTFEQLLVAFEIHDPGKIREIVDGGFDVTRPVNGQPPIDALIEMYFRSDRFPECLRILLDHGAVPADPKLLPVLLDDPRSLEEAARTDPTLLSHRTSLPCAFTPLSGVTLLHVAAEYGHLEVAKKLLELGADVNARAAVDAHGLNGHTPLFHTVNSNGNRSASLMRLLLDAGAHTDTLLPGIVWGRGFAWETTCFDVTPISYAQLGLLPQMQRTEEDSYANLRVLLTAAGRQVPPLENVPNRYLAG